MEPRWVNLLQRTPVASDFTTTNGLGSPLCVDTVAGVIYGMVGSAIVPFARFGLIENTAALWAATNPTLLAGQLAYESDTGAFKVGDGITAWNSLDYSAQTFRKATILASTTNTTFIRPSEFFGNIANGLTIYSSSPDFSTPHPLEIICSELLLEPTVGIVVNPKPNSLAQGLVTSQSSPTSGTTSGPFAFNGQYGTIRSALITGGIPGASGSGTWIGQQISWNVGGPNYQADSFMALSVGTVQTVADTSTGDKNGVSSGVSIQASTLGKAYAISSGASVTTTGSCPALFGCEVDVVNDSTGVDHVIGYNAWCGSSKPGNLTHAAYTIGITGGTGPSGLGVAPWKTGFRLFTQGGVTNDPLATTASLFDADKAMTIANVFSYANITVTGKILDFPHVQLTGAGDLTLDGNVTAPNVLPVIPLDWESGFRWYQPGGGQWAAIGVAGGNDIATEGPFGYFAINPSTDIVQISAWNAAFTEGFNLKNDVNANGRHSWSFTHSPEFDMDPYVGANLIYHEGNIGSAWTAFTPTVAPTSGAFTTLGTVTGRYKKIGKSLFVSYDLTITNNGTGSGFILVSLPSGMSFASTVAQLTGREAALTGKVLQGFASDSTHFAVMFYDSTYPGGNGVIFRLNGVVEIA